jgi:hypothetical protein
MTLSWTDVLTNYLCKKFIKFNCDVRLMIELMLAKEPESRGHLAMPGNKLDPAAGKKNSVPVSISVLGPMYIDLEKGLLWIWL